MSDTPPPPAGPAPVWDVINGMAAYWALRAAVDLGVFDALADGPLTAAELAASVQVTAEDLTLLAELLVSLDLLGTDGVTFATTPAAQRFLVSSSPASMTDLVRFSPGPLDGWTELAHTLRAGAPAPSIVVDHVSIVRATAGTQRAVAAGVAAHEAVRSALAGSPSVVDLGCGSGVWLDQLLAPDGVRGLGVDSADVLAVAGQTLTGKDVELIAGDYLEVELPASDAGVVVLAHVLRAESTERATALLQRGLQLLAPGGVLAVADYFRPDSDGDASTYRAARHDLTLALTMRASTAGRGITESWLRDTAAAHGAGIVATVEPLPRQRVHLLRTTAREEHRS